VINNGLGMEILGYQLHNLIFLSSKNMILFYNIYEWGDINVSFMSTNMYSLPHKFHCIKCGRVWGEGNDGESFGICIHCFAEWAKSKMTCFGEGPYVENSGCKYEKYCKEYYEFKQSLLR